MVHQFVLGSRQEARQHSSVGKAVDMVKSVCWSRQDLQSGSGPGKQARQDRAQGLAQEGRFLVFCRLVQLNE